MKNGLLAVLLLFATTFPSCNEDSDEPVIEPMYFPPATGTWEVTTPQSLGWDVSQIPAFNDYLLETNTRAFIILVKGRIVMEEYFGTTLVNPNAAFTMSSNWYWASAGKTLVAATCGIAEEQGHLSFTDKTAMYLGSGWSSLTQAQEDKITLLHQLTMTTGLDDAVANPDCTLPECMVYKAEPAERWAYHNGPYTLLHDVISEATNQTFTQYFNSTLRDRVGMDGSWVTSNTYNSVYYSTPRSMARFGLLLLNRGTWNNEPVIQESYIDAMSTTSQPLNQSYGYLTWLNGKTSFMAPILQTVFPGSLTPNAPPGMFAAMGKNGQLINVIPDREMVIIRMGDNPDATLVPFLYQNELWEKLNLIIR